MAGPDRDHPNNLVDAIKNVFDTTPEGEEGLGPTLGQDLGSERRRTTKPQSDANSGGGADADQGASK